MSVAKVFRGSLWLYLGVLIYSILSFVFWLLASLFVTPNVIGSAAAILAVQTLFLSLLSLGIPTGLRRFIGAYLGENDSVKISTYFWTSILFFVVIYIPLTIVLFLLSYFGIPIFNLTFVEIYYVLILLLLSFWPPLFTAFFESLLKTEISAIGKILFSITKIVIGVFLLFIGLDLIGILWAFIIASIALDGVLLVYYTRISKEYDLKVTTKRKVVPEIIHSGFPFWLPAMLQKLAVSIGILSIYGVIGNIETGLYHIAFAISAIVYSIPTIVQSLIIPVLSGMQNGRERAALQAIRIALAITAPLGFALALYSILPFIFLGTNYLPASNILSILLLGAIISPITMGYIGYVFVIGKYRHATTIGLFAASSRIALYVILIPFLGSIGVAVAYISGEIISLLLILSLSRRIGFDMQWKLYTKAIAVPGLIVVLLFLLNFIWLIGIPTVLGISLIAYSRLGVISKSDVLEIANAFFSRKSLAKMARLGSPILKFLFKEEI